MGFRVYGVDGSVRVESLGLRVLGLQIVTARFSGQGSWGLRIYCRAWGLLFSVSGLGVEVSGYVLHHPQTSKLWILQWVWQPAFPRAPVT